MTNNTPTLTPYDTGEVATPIVWNAGPESDDMGKIDFTNDEGGMVAVARMVRDPHDGAYVLKIDHWADGLRVEFTEDLSTC